MIELLGDFETASHANLKEVGAWRYSEDATTEILCFSYKVNGHIKTWRPGDDITELEALANNPDVVFISHNAGFEKAHWRNIMVAIYGLPDVPNTRWDDTLAACAMFGLPLDLDHATLVLRLTNHKDKEGSNFTKNLSKPNRKGYYDRSPESLMKTQVYCEQDIRAEFGLRQRLGSLPVGERNVWLLDQRINERGVRLDLPFIDAAQKIVDLASPPLIEEFMQITGGLKPSQAVRLKVWLAEQGVVVESLRKELIAALLGESEEEDTDDSLDISDLPDNVRRALTIRGLVNSASVKKLKRMKACVGMDGRARGLLQYHGAATGRWAGRLLQPQNFPRGTIKDVDPESLVNVVMTGDPDTVEMLVGPPIETIVSSLRHAIVADPGKTLLSGDFAGVEARLILALSGQHDKTELMAKGMNAYCDMGLGIYGRVIDKKKDPDEYHVSKGAVLGLGFQMAWKTFQSRVAKDKPEEFCRKVVDTYRKDWAPCVPPVWDDLQQAALQTVQTGNPHEAYGVLYQAEDRWISARLPSGRKLWYFNPQLIRRPMPWDDTDIRLAWTYQQKKTGQWKTIDAYGGLLTENVIQGLARDLMVDAMFRLEKNGFPIILTVHDEIVCEPLAKDADEKAFQQIMCEMPQWAKNIQMPVAVETWCGDRYKK